MNKLLQHMVSAGDVSDKFLTGLPKGVSVSDVRNIRLQKFQKGTTNQQPKKEEPSWYDSLVDYVSSFFEDEPQVVTAAYEAPAKTKIRTAVPIELLKRQAWKESNFNPDAYNKGSQATGMTQIKPIALKDYNQRHGTKYYMSDLKDPKVAIEVQNGIMEQLYSRPWVNRKGQPQEVTDAKAVIAYNYGPSATVKKLNELKAQGIDIYSNNDWVQYFPTEPRDYTQKIVMRKYPKFNREYDSASRVNPIMEYYEDYENDFRYGGLTKAQDGQEYTGPSIVNFLASKGRKFDKDYRTYLAEKAGVEDYDFSAEKNLELLAKLRENLELLAQEPQAFKPASFSSPPPKISAEEGERLANFLAYQQSINRGLADAAKAGTAGQTTIPVVNNTQQPLVRTAPQEILMNLYNQSIEKAAADANKVTIPMRRVGVQPTVATQLPATQKTTAKAAAKKLQESAKMQSWFQGMMNNISSAFDEFPLDFRNIDFSGTGYVPGSSEDMFRDLSIRTAGVVSEDLGKMAKSYYDRQDLKSNPNLKETQTKFTIPSDSRPAIIAGDTIPINKDRYVIPAMIDLNQTKWGIRNRGDYSPIQTDAADITTFQNFVPAKEYFPGATEDKENSTYVGVDPQGNVKVGNKKDFVNTDYAVSKTFGNRIVDFASEADGSMKLKNSSPAASNVHLSPVIKVLGDDGKIVDGRMNLLIPKKSRDTKSFGQITGGRVIFKTPTGEQFLVSGSAEDIRKAFYNIKGDHPWVEAVTLDNGSYAMGYRTKKGNITEQELRDYQGSNRTGSAFLYLKPGDYSTDSSEKKYKDVAMTTPNIRTEQDDSFKKGHPLKNLQEAVVLHHTGFSDTTGVSKGMSQAMKGVDQYFQKPGQASSHIVIDFDGTRYNYARPDQVTFHAGKSRLRDRENLNDFSLGIEFQGDTDQRPLTDEQIESFVEYIAPIIRDKKIPLENIVTHKDIRTQYMKGNPKDRKVETKADVNERDYNRIVAALRKKGVYEHGGVVVDPRGQWAHPGKHTIVPTPNGGITMQGVDYPVYGQDETGYSQMMMPGGEYMYPGNFVYEVPMMQGGGQKYVDSVFNANKGLNWVQRLYEQSPKSIMLPGQKHPSTHFMESGNGRVYPTIVEMPNGNLQYLGKNAYDYADSTGTYIQFPTDKAAQWFGKNYKKGTGVLSSFAKGGQHGGLDRWFAEKWVDVKTGKPCGRQEGEDRSYPACRPSRRVSSQTPKTSSEMSPAEKAKFKRVKTSSQRISYNHKRNS
jgi:hypothetical protein